MQVKKSEKLSKIIKAATKLFLEKSFYDVTIEEIALEAKIGKGTVYTYVSSKTELLIKCLTYNIPEIDAERRRILDSESLSFEEIMTKLVEIQFRESKTKGPLLRQLLRLDVRHFKENSKRNFAKYKKMVREYSDRLTLFFQNAKASKKTNTSLTARQMAIVFQNMFEFNFACTYYGEEPMGVDSIVKLLKTIFAVK